MRKETRKAFITTYYCGSISLGLGMIQRQMAKRCLVPERTVQEEKDNYLLKVIMYKEN